MYETGYYIIILNEYYQDTPKNLILDSGFSIFFDFFAIKWFHRAVREAAPDATNLSLPEALFQVRGNTVSIKLGSEQAVFLHQYGGAKNLVLWKDYLVRGTKTKSRWNIY